MGLIKDKGGEAGDNSLVWQFAYLLIGLIFFSLAFYWIFGLEDGAALWEDYYAKEIAMVINLAEPGQEVYLDVHKGVAIALKKKSPSEMFNFDNRNNQVIVSLRNNGGRSFSFFNDVDVVDWEVRVADGSEITNRLYFKVVEPRDRVLDLGNESEEILGGGDEQ